MCCRDGILLSVVPEAWHVRRDLERRQGYKNVGYYANEDRTHGGDKRQSKDGKKKVNFFSDFKSDTQIQKQ